MKELRSALLRMYGHFRTMTKKNIIGLILEPCNFFRRLIKYDIDSSAVECVLIMFCRYSAKKKDTANYIITKYSKI